MTTDIPPSPELSLVVLGDEEGQRLDSYLPKKLPEYSRSQFKQWIEGGLVLVGGRQVKAGYSVHRGEEIAVQIPLPRVDDTLVPEPMSLDILHEDDEILVINKAPGIVVHPGAGHGEGTLVHGLLAHCPRLAMQGAPLRPGIVHRLDQNTSGALVIAKTERAYLDLIRKFKDRRVEKVYLALVHGRFSAAKGEIRTYLGRHPGERKKMAVVQKQGREAITHWGVEKELGEVTLLRIRIETGRTHQIRVHMSHMQHPVVGDSSYGGGKRRAGALKSKALRDLLLQVDRQMLHAWQLSFEHPASCIPLSFVAPLPKDFSNLMANLQELHFSEG